MADSTTQASATSGGVGITEAAEAWQDVLTPGRSKPARDTDDDQEPAQQGKKPTGKPAKAKPQAASDTDDGADEGDDDTSGEGSEGADEGDDGGQDGDQGEGGEDQGDESGESEGEESEGESEGEEGADDGSDDDTTYTVTHADGTQEDVTVGELVKGYYRQQDYTRKTQAVAQERRQVQGERQEVHGLRAQYARGLEQLQAAIEQITPQEPDWDDLRANDPIEYGRQWADHQRRQQTLQAIAQERRQVEEQHQAEFAAHQQEARRAAGEWLLERIPSWKDVKVRTAERAEMRAFAQKMGFSEQELKNTDDPRAVLLIRQAWQFAKLQERKAVVVKPKAKAPVSAGTKTPVLKPLAVKQPVSKKASQLSDAKKRHAREQSVASAANFFKTLL